MTGKFQEIRPEQINENVIRLIGHEWMLITAGTAEHFNMMTASWGGLGYLWDKPVCFVFVRPQRYTYPLLEKHACFTLTFFEERHREALNFCGAHSGRDVNKVAETGLTPVVGATGAVYFAEARLALECRKLYAQDLTAESFIDPQIITATYRAGDFHRLYVGEIVHGWRQ